MREFRRCAVSAAFFWLCASAACAEPARADAAFAAGAAESRSRPRVLTVIPFGGASFALVATGRAAGVDTQMANDNLREALAMNKVMPGYPQPAHVTIDVRVSF